MNLTTGTKPPKFWAVGMKGWVEIRSSPTSLRLHQSRATLKVKAPGGPIYDFWGYPIGDSLPQPKTYTITCKVWLGGAIVGRVKASMFRNRAGFTVGNGKCERISKPLVTLLLRKEK